MREQAVLFGQQQNLVGVFSRPGNGGELAYPGVLLWNAGVLHRIGPHRLWVETARRLSERGYPVLRFDLGGLGDSEQAGTASHEDAVTKDISQAMDWLAEKSGTREFILIGLCSGADDAWPVAVTDARVTGLISLDGFAYPTPAYRHRKLLHHYPRRLLSPRKWQQLIKRKFAQWFRREAEITSDADTFRRIPPRQDALSQLQTLIDRGTKTLFIYSGGHDLFNYEAQFFDALAVTDPDKSVEVVYFPEYDHMYSVLTDQATLLDTLCGWVERCHPAHKSAAQDDQDVSGFI